MAREREALSAVNEASAAREHRKAEADMPTARDLVDEAVALGLRQATTQAAAGRRRKWDRELTARPRSTAEPTQKLAVTVVSVGCSRALPPGSSLGSV